jgi:putative ABC transport system permease protein
MKFLGLVWSNLKRKKLRTVLTLLSIFVAFLLFGFLCAIKEAFLAGVNLAGADRLIVRHKVSFIQPLPQSYQARIEALPGVDAVASMTWFGGIYKDPKNFMATFPVDPDKYLDMYSEVVVTPEVRAKWKQTRNGAIVGKTTFDRFAKSDGWKIGDRIPFTSPIWGQPAGQPHWEFEIVGTYAPGKKGADDTGFIFRYDYFEEARQDRKGTVGWFGVRVKDAGQAAEVAKRIDEQFANSPSETKAEPEGAFAAGFASQIGDIATIVAGVVSAVFFTILLVAGNTMSQSVRERTEEIGVQKAMGFPNSLVLALVLIESCLIAMLGGLAGLGVAWLITLGGSPIPQMLPVFIIPNRDLALGAVFAVALGLIAGAIPAYQAMRLRIAEALRRTG